MNEIEILSRVSWWTASSPSVGGVGARVANLCRALLRGVPADARRVDVSMLLRRC